MWPNCGAHNFTMAAPVNLSFMPFETNFEIPFYQELAAIKLDHDKLKVSARQVVGVYQIPFSNNQRKEEKAKLMLSGNAFRSPKSVFI